MTPKLKEYRVFWGLFLGLLLLDQLTKFLLQAFQHERGQTLLGVWPGFFSLVYVQNTGAAWGMMAGSGYVLGALAVLALLAIYFLRKALQIKRPLLQVAFGLLAAGIAGNMIDRLALGYVVDFIDCNIFNMNFPAFNVADIGITVGVGLYIFYSAVMENRKA